MNRRDFLVNTTAASMTLGIALSGGEAFASEKKAPGKVDAAKPVASTKPAALPAEKPKSPVSCAVIGLGDQGHAILDALDRMASGAPVIAICDTYKAPVFIRRAKEHFHNDNVAVYDDYRKVLDDKSIQAVFIATPSHKHKQIALDAIAAGKHVYCETPLSIDLDEAKAMAQAGTAAKTIFQPGLQMRSNMQYKHVLHFVKSNSLGVVTMGRAQWHKRDSWRHPAPTDVRQNELNWRLAQATSLGLMGEVGMHQLDVANWFLGALPLAISGNGGILGWKDGRDVQDTVQCVLEYPNDVRFMYDATLTNSFDGSYDALYGTVAAIQLRDQRAWMFKEADANATGWETFARKDVLSIGKPENGTGIKLGEGIALVADATKQLKLGKQPGEVGTDVSHTSLYQSIDGFLDSIRTNGKAWVSPLEGYQANVLAAKANEACLKNTRIELKSDWFAL